nr:MAG TPA: hypothetical protein [Caudoviricetes sp.]
MTVSHSRDSRHGSLVNGAFTLMASRVLAHLPLGVLA